MHPRAGEAERENEGEVTNRKRVAVGLREIRNGALTILLRFCDLIHKPIRVLDAKKNASLVQEPEHPVFSNGCPLAGFRRGV